VGRDVNPDSLLLAELDERYPFADPPAAPAGFPKPELVGTEPALFKIR
jgi:hypothetical protein